MNVERARQWLKTMSAPEARLWNALRELRPLGHHFRRQTPISIYFADFCCHKAKLILKLMAICIFDEAAIEHDIRRDALLRRGGYSVLPVTNNDVMHDIDDVQAVILGALDQPPPSIPPHKGEGGQPGGSE